MINCVNSVIPNEMVVREEEKRGSAVGCCVAKDVVVVREDVVVEDKVNGWWRPGGVSTRQEPGRLFGRCKEIV